jgi:DNA-binding NarL/FixJ family response regulator
VRKLRRADRRVARHDLVVALDTVKNHVTHVLGKLGTATAPRLPRSAAGSP